MAEAALCVGVNVFQNFPGATLQGCVNDAQDMRKLLTEAFGFAPGDVVTLTDAQATKANILERLREMVDGARAGRLDYLVFSMSSHGTQVPDVHGDEPDRADEAFCPHDLAARGKVWDPDHLIVDDELNALFVQLPRNVLLEVFLDTCHSGTGLRAQDLLPDRRPRFLPPPSPEALAEVEARGSFGIRHYLRQQRELPHQILWAACRANQTSADAHLGGGWHGAFTYYLCREVRACGNQLSRRDLLARVRSDLAAGHFAQTPQLECSATGKRAAPAEVA